jgi:hypothetical protein
MRLDLQRLVEAGHDEVQIMAPVIVSFIIRTLVLLGVGYAIGSLIAWWVL